MHGERASAPLSLRLIRELHGRLLEGARGQYATPGEFRRSQNWIGRPDCTLNEANFVPPPVEEMLAALGALEKYLSAQLSVDRLVKAGIVRQLGHSSYGKTFIAEEILRVMGDAGVAS